MTIQLPKDGRTCTDHVERIEHGKPVFCGAPAVVEFHYGIPTMHSRQGIVGICQKHLIQSPYGLDAGQVLMDGKPVEV